MNWTAFLGRFLALHRIIPERHQTRQLFLEIIPLNNPGGERSQGNRGALMQAVAE